MRTRRHERIALGILLMMLVGCSASQPDLSDAPLEAADGPRIAAVSRVVVSVLPDLDAGRAERLQQEEADAMLQRTIEGELSKGGRLTPDHGPSLEVTISHFRLRSTAASFWLGSMAGNDSMHIEVEVRDEEEPIKSFTLRRSSILGGVVLPAADVRLRRICEALASDIAQQL